jgi:hypothetical protein
MYADILGRLRDGVSRKLPEKRRIKIWFFLHANAPAHRSVSVKDFSAKNNVTTLQHPTYFLAWLRLIFFMFPRLKSALIGWRFCAAADIIKNATEELKRLSQNGFQEYFQHLYSRWQKCIFEKRGIILKEI